MKLYIHGGSWSFITQRLMDREEGPGNDWSWVILYLGMHSPHSLMVSCSMHPNGASEAFGMRCKVSKGRGKANPHSMSSVMIESRMPWCLIVDLWFLRVRCNSRSRFHSSSEIGSRGNDAPWESICDRLGQCGWNGSKGWKISTCQNSDPKDTWVFGELQWPL